MPRKEAPGVEDTVSVVIRHLAAIVGRAAGAARAIAGGHRRSGLDEGDRRPVAQQTTTTLVDDLDDTVTAQETVSVWMHPRGPSSFGALCTAAERPS